MSSKLENMAQKFKILLKQRRKQMKKLLIASLFVTLIVSNVYAYNPHSFYDQEQINIHGNRPKVDIEVSEIDVTILPEDFVDGIATKSVKISNEGNVPCRIELELQNIPIDLQVEAIVDSEYLLKGEMTGLTITVELTEQMEEEIFNFIVLVKANLRP
ncbi:MAG: hypothetical protein ACTSXT_13290 [Candidatus Helarchaeota archaeon]